MKTDQEIQREAERLEQLARQWIVAGANPAAATLAVLPETRIGVATRLPRRHLRIEIARDDDAPEFLLLQEDIEPREVPGSTAPFVLTRSSSAYDVLRDGYEEREEERLVEALTPILNRAEADGFADDADPELVAEIETLIEVDRLNPSARLRTRADIVEVLEGRLEPGEFITSTIERKGRRLQHREFVAEVLEERMTVT
ncbi:MAG TPA: hypothetical protein VHD32_01155 [Candidatus Didemnitutus sp.]|nr:hypothetical protein [Candidatus Didemnitutus sp.]